jgi:hypothetical protein
MAKRKNNGEKWETNRLSLLCCIFKRGSGWHRLCYNEWKELIMKIYEGNTIIFVCVLFG